MISYKESLKILKETNALLEGHFILSSGLHSAQYIQCAKLLSKPDKAQKICSSLAHKIQEKFKSIDLVISPAIGGIVVGYEIGRQLKKETIFAERSDGILNLRRGFEIAKNLNVLIVEDVITTGKSALECAHIVNKCKSKVLGYACIIDRSSSNLLIKDTIVSQIKFEINTYTEKNLPADLSKIIPIKPGSRNINK